MAGYIFKTFNHSAPANGATTVLFTVPAGHIYVVKNAMWSSAKTNAAGTTISLEKSDNAGANFRTVTGTVNLTTANGVVDVVNFCKGSNSSQGASTTTPSQGVNALDNMVFEAGSVLRIVAAGGNFAPSSMEVGGIDYTI